MARYTMTPFSMLGRGFGRQWERPFSMMVFILFEVREFFYFFFVRCSKKGGKGEEGKEKGLVGNFIVVWVGLFVFFCFNFVIFICFAIHVFL